MIIYNLQISELIIIILTLLIILLFFMFQWFFKEVRDIARAPQGFIKFGQITFILLSWGAFLVILVYNIIVPRDVDSVNVILTIVVGFLGTILGLFFSDKALERMSERIQTKEVKLKEKIGRLEEYIKLIDEAINKLK